MSSEAKQELWASIVEISVYREGARSFTIDSTAETRQGEAEHRAQLTRLFGTVANYPRRQLHSIDGLLSALSEIGPSVLSLNLYADTGWVSGISDWGQDMSVLFDSQAWTELQKTIARLSPPPVFDIAEASSRPTEIM